MSTFREMLLDEGKGEKAYMQSILGRVERVGEDKFKVKKKKIGIDGDFMDLYFKSEDEVTYAKSFIKSILDHDKFAILKKVNQEGKLFQMSVVMKNGPVIYKESDYESVK
jgi:hypothetical protein